MGKEGEGEARSRSEPTRLRRVEPVLRTGWALPGVSRRTQAPPTALRRLLQPPCKPYARLAVTKGRAKSLYLAERNDRGRLESSPLLLSEVKYSRQPCAELSAPAEVCEEQGARAKPARGASRRAFGASSRSFGPAGLRPALLPHSPLASRQARNQPLEPVPLKHLFIIPRLRRDQPVDGFHAE